MKIISEITGKTYKTVAECEAAEKEAQLEAQRKKEEQEAQAKNRKARAEEVGKAYEAMLAAKKKYNELLRAFVSDYGSYHYSIPKDRIDTDDILSWFFR